jgi:hypothetical protein
VEKTSAKWVASAAHAPLVVAMANVMRLKFVMIAYLIAAFVLLKFQIDPITFPLDL